MSNEKTKYHLKKKAFLNTDPECTEFVIAVVEDTRHIPDNDDDQSWKWTHKELVIGDKYDAGRVTFNMETLADRKESLRKIKKLKKIIEEMHNALRVEAASINSRPSQRELRKRESKIIELTLVA